MLAGTAGVVSADMHRGGGLGPQPTVLSRWAMGAVQIMVTEAPRRVDRSFNRLSRAMPQSSAGWPAGLPTCVAGLGRECLMPAGTCLFERGGRAEGIVFVIDGLVMLTRSEDDGNELGVALVGSGGVAGLSAALASMHYAVDAVCTTSCRIQQVSTAQLHGALASDPDVQRWMTMALARGEAAAYGHLTVLAPHNTAARLSRLVRLLAELADFRATDGGLQLCPPLHHRDLALLIGRAPEKLSASVHALLRTGAISLGRGGRLAVPPRRPFLDGSARLSAVDERQDRS